MKPETRLIEWLSERISVPVKSEVPNPRPASFVTVDRTGGSRRDVIIDDAQVDVFCWAKTRSEALELADEVDGVMPSFAAQNDVFKVERQTFSWMPSSDLVPRYLLGFKISVNAL